MTISIDFLDTVKEDLSLLQSEADSLKDSVDAPLDQTGLSTEKTNIENTITSIESEISDIDDEIDALDPEDPYYDIDLEILTDDKTRLQNQILTLDSTLSSLSDLSNTLDDVQDLINLSGNSTLDVFGDVSSGIDGITQGIQDKVKILDSKCNLPLPLSQIGIEDLKSIAEKFAAKQVLTIALESAKQGIPSNVLSQATSVVGKFNSIRSSVQGKLDTLKGAASKAQSLKGDFSSLVNGELTPEGILSVAQKWGGNVPGLNGLLDTASQGLNALQNFDICSLVPNFKLNPETGNIREEPNDPVPPTEEPEPAKILVPTVEDSRQKETQTIDEKYGGSVQVDEKRQVELEKQREIYDKEYAAATEDVTNRFKEVDKALKANMASNAYKSLLEKSKVLQQPIWRVVEISQLSPEEENAYIQNRELNKEWSALSDLISRLKEFEFIYRNRLTNRAKNNSGKANAIANANKSIQEKLTDEDYFRDVVDYTPKVNFSYVNEQAEKCFNVLKKHSSQLYDYYNYYDHNV
jgi:hypothetical protein